MQQSDSFKQFSQLIVSSKILSAVSTKKGSLDDLKLHLKNSKFIEMEQPHSNKVTQVCKHVTKNSYVNGTDALMCQDTHIALVVRTADCLPILLSSDTGWIAAAHAGRKSTQLGLTKNLIDVLKQKDPHITRLDVWLGPCICKACYQIDTKTGACFDLVATNIQQLKMACLTNKHPVKLNMIHSGICTLCHPDRLFYSHRRGDAERFYSVICRIN